MKLYAIAEDCYVQALGNDCPDLKNEEMVVLLRFGLYATIFQAKEQVDKLNNELRNDRFFWVELEVNK